MEADLVFQLELDYMTTPYPSLKDKAISVTYDKNKKKFLWLFYIKDIDNISGILGKPITFESQEQNINKLIGLCPPLKGVIKTERYKGIGETTITEEPKIFLIGEWQKDPRTNTPKQSWQRIPKEVVLVNWDIIKEYPLGKWIKIRTQAEHVCRRLGFDLLFRESGSFDWKKFSGMHRTGHLPYCYYPVKVLAHLGVIGYSKIGKLKRIKNKLEFQHYFTKKIGDRDIIPKDLAKDMREAKNV